MEPSRNEYKILLYVSQYPSCTTVDLLNVFIGKINVNKAKQLISALCMQHFLSISDSGRIKCEPLGLVALSRYQERRRKERSSMLIVFIQICLALFPFIAPIFF